MIILDFAEVLPELEEVLFLGKVCHFLPLLLCRFRKVKAKMTSEIWMLTLEKFVLEQDKKKREIIRTIVGAMLKRREVPPPPQKGENLEKIFLLQ
jgi:hypothetical protein